MSDYDAIVVGLGGMGSSAAFHLARRGLRVLGIEQFEPAHDKGSSHGDSRIIRQAYFEHPGYVPLLRRSYELWDELSRESGRQLVTITGGLNMGRPDAATVSGSIASARQWGLPHETLDAGQVAARFPTLALGEDEIAVYEPNAGYVRPETAVLANIDAARAAGARLWFGQRVERWDSNEHGVEVTVRGERVTAKRLVICAGAWAPRLLAELNLPLVVERQVVHWFEPADVAPFAAHPVYIRETPDGDQIYGFPALPSENSVKLAFFRRQNRCDPDAVDRTVSNAETAEIAAAARRFLPGVGRHLRAKTCMYTLSPDHNFIIGSYQGRDRVTIAAGFSGHGFKFVPVVGEILADVATEGGARHDIGLFDPSRHFAKELA